MSRIEQILFPIDFSERCIAAAAHVRDWAEHFSAGIIALHVVDPVDFFASLDTHSQRGDEELDTLYAQRLRDLDYFCNHYLANFNPLQKFVAIGTTAYLILAIANREKVDLIMLPREHQSLGSRLLHDSITATVLDSAVSAVWTSQKSKIGPVVPLKQIVCAVHVDADPLLDAANQRLLDFARLVAAGFAAKVTYLYVKDSGHHQESVAISSRLAAIRHEMQGLAEFETASGSITQAILEVSSRKSADLIMLGRTRRGTVGLGAQPHILSIEHAARCPVLSVL